MEFFLGAVLLAVNLAALGDGRQCGKVTIGGPRSPDGKAEVATDLPAEMRHRNRVGTNGAGLCVFASLDHAALYQNDEATIGIFQKMFKEPGAGWPEKVTKMMARYCSGAKYVQYQGKNPLVLELALKTGRMPAVTYNSNHMVNLVYLDERWACCLDNNFIGENELRWFPRSEFLNRVWTSGGSGWAVVLLHPRPPAPPRNKEVREMRMSDYLVGLALSFAAMHAVPAEMPEPDVAQHLGVLAAGVQRGGCPDCELCECNGCQCSFAEMLAAVGEGGDVPDDFNWPSLTFIGTKEETSRARGQLEASPAAKAVVSRYLVQEYRTNNPMVAKAGFRIDGHPTIYAQRPDGQVLFRLDSFPGVAAILDALRDGLGVEEAIRKPNPDYDSGKDDSGLLSIKPKVNADVSPAPWLLLLSHAATLLVGGLGALGGRWAVVAMIVEPMIASLEARIAAKMPAPPTAAASA